MQDAWLPQVRGCGLAPRIVGAPGILGRGCRRARRRANGLGLGRYERKRQERQKGGKASCRFDVRITDAGFTVGSTWCTRWCLRMLRAGSPRMPPPAGLRAERAQETAIEPPLDPEHPPTRRDFWVAGQPSRSLLERPARPTRRAANRGTELRPEAQELRPLLSFLTPSKRTLLSPHTAWGLSVGLPFAALLPLHASPRDRSG